MHSHNFLHEYLNPCPDLFACYIKSAQKDILQRMHTNKHFCLLHLTFRITFTKSNFISDLHKQSPINICSDGPAVISSACLAAAKDPPRYLRST